MGAWSSFWESADNWFHGHGWRDYGEYNPKNPLSTIQYNGGTTQQGDSFTSATGFNTSGIGEELNDLTGVSASQQWQSAEAEKQREYETAERLATQQYNSAEAQLSRDWQLSMDSTQVQRRMEDLQAAGINPMSVVSGGSFLSGVGSSGSTAASVSPGSGAAAQGSGNSASAVGSAIRAVGSLVATIAKIAA